MKPVPKSAVVLSMVVVVCAAAASLITLVWRGAFLDPSPTSISNRVLAEARGWSVATLLVAIPLAIVSLRAACRGSLRGRLVWLGALAYFVYTYLEFAVSPPFTALYLLYVVAFACAIPALVIGAASIDVAELPTTFGALSVSASRSLSHASSTSSITAITSSSSSASSSDCTHLSSIANSTPRQPIRVV